MWLFYIYPFNGTARVELFAIDLEKLSEHVGVWEHVMLRISYFDGQLQRIYFAQHGSGTRVRASELEDQSGNKFSAYSSLHGHASNSKQSTLLQGNDGMVIWNNYSRIGMFLDRGRTTLLAAKYLGQSLDNEEPSWVEHLRECGPKVEYDTTEELNMVGQVLLRKLKTAFMDTMQSLPIEVLREVGPSGPKMKPSWSGDES